MTNYFYHHNPHNKTLYFPNLTDCINKNRAADINACLVPEERKFTLLKYKDLIKSFCIAYCLCVIFSILSPQHQQNRQTRLIANYQFPIRSGPFQTNVFSRTWAEQQKRIFIWRIEAFRRLYATIYCLEPYYVAKIKTGRFLIIFLLMLIIQNLYRQLLFKNKTNAWNKTFSMSVSKCN